MQRSFQSCWVCEKCNFLITKSELDFFQITRPPVTCSRCGWFTQQNKTLVKRKDFNG